TVPDEHLRIPRRRVRQPVAPGDPRRTCRYRGGLPSVQVPDHRQEGGGGRSRLRRRAGAGDRRVLNPMVRPDPGSFRDPASRVVFHDGRVLRLLDQRGLEAWNAVASAEFFTRGIAAGRIIETEPTRHPTGTAAAAL